MEKIHVCPWWLGYFLAHPLRKLRQDPVKILSPYVKKGMIVADVGCGMGFFSIPMTDMVGNKGHVHCVDMQQKMLASLQKRARRAGVTERVTPHLCTEKSLSIDMLAGKVDFVLAFAMVHEAPDKNRLFTEFSTAMKKGSLLLIAEPKNHITQNKVAEYIEEAGRAGLRCVEKPLIPLSHTLLLRKK